MLPTELLPKALFPFTGKGAMGAWRSAIEAHRVETTLAMRKLRDKTVSVPARSIYLELYRRNDSGAATLRWRRTGGGHCTWESLRPEIVAMAPAIRDWYGQAQSTAAWLNSVEATLRQLGQLAERADDALHAPGVDAVGESS